jgi:PEP-CTERM motif
VTFGGYQGNSSNELVQNIHQGASLNAAGVFTLGPTYNESASGTGNGQIRSAYSPDGSAYVFADKDGVYTGGAGPAPTTNVRYLAGFGGTDFALAQASSATLPSTTAFFTYSAGTLTPVSVPNSNFSAGTDFDFVQSGAVGEGDAYDTLYVANGTSILKYDYTGGTLTAEGVDVVTGLGGKIVDLTAEEDGLGDVDIYFTAGGNTTLDETIDTTGWDNPIGNTAATLLYTAPTGQDLFGVSVAPVAVPEPASVGLLGLTALGLLSRRRKSVAK